MDIVKWIQPDETLTVKTIKINYISIIKHSVNNNNLINQFIKNIVPNFAGDVYATKKITTKLLNMKCFTITKTGLLVFIGAVGLLKSNHSDDCQIAIADSVKNLRRIADSNHKMYGMVKANTFITKDFSLSESIIYDYINWLKKQEQCQAKTLSQPEIANLVYSGKSIIDMDDMERQLIKNAQQEIVVASNRQYIITCRRR